MEKETSESLKNPSVLDWSEWAREAELRQEESMPKSDLTPYTGEWVALRQGIIIAHDRDYGELRGSPHVLDTDVAVWVPRAEDIII